MTMNAVSSSQGASALWAALMTQRSSQASGTTSGQDFSAQMPPPPPRPEGGGGGPAPGGGMGGMGLSTQSFAQCSRQDPIASLDEDGDGSVSSDEFGLEGASEEVQKLFAAIDGDGDGSLSGEEIEGFREQMQAREQVQRLAQRYAELTGGDSQASGALSVEA